MNPGPAEPAIEPLEPLGICQNTPWPPAPRSSPDSQDSLAGRGVKGGPVLGDPCQYGVGDTDQEANTATVGLGSLVETTSSATAVLLSGRPPEPRLIKLMSAKRDFGLSQPAKMEVDRQGQHGGVVGCGGSEAKNIFFSEESPTNKRGDLVAGWTLSVLKNYSTCLRPGCHSPCPLLFQVRLLLLV